MIKPIDRKAVLRYVHESEIGKDKKPKEGASVFLYRGLSKRVKAHVSNIAMYMKADDDGESQALEMRTGSVAYCRVQFGLVGVENFKGWKTEADPLGLCADGEELPTAAFLDTLPDYIFDGIGRAVDAASRFTVADAEKS